MTCNEERDQLLHELNVHQAELEAQNLELREARKELEDTLEKFASLFDFAPIGYIIMNSKGRITEVNESAAALLGTSKSVIKGSYLNNFIISNELAAYSSYLLRCRRSRVREDIELHMCTSGKTIPVQLSTVTFLSAEGAISLRTALIDVSERKKMEALEESRRRLQMIMDIIPVPIIYLNADLRFEYGNGPFCAKWGLSAEDLKGKTVRGLLGDRVFLQVEPHLQRALTGEEVSYEMEHDYGPPMGIRYVSAAYVPHHGSDGTVIGLVAAIVDLTERRMLEEALREAHDEQERQVAERTAELREKDQLLLHQSRQAALGEMINNIAHQWRQPLNALGLIIQSLSMEFETGTFNGESLENMERKAMDIIYHMSQTIEDFRNYFKPDKEIVLFSVARAVSRTVSLVGDSLRNHHIEIEVNALDEPFINGFPNEFSQVLLNMLINARDALLERRVSDPKVIITIRSEDGKAVVIITDNAGGIPEHIMDRIFDPYFSTKGPDKGTGVGLFMSKGIIEKNMGGRITVRNTGDGAEFRIEV
jgi:two-component system C4-dicarboxylate transport sensor histidine kinase DctB